MEKETPKEKIQFKPLHEGMGFHPFSDGLPYAPSTKAPTPTQKPTPTTGTGAVAAGRPQFVTKTYPRPVTQNAPTQHKLDQHLNLNPSAHTATRTMSKPAMATLDHQVLRRRAFAYLLDMVVHAGFWLLTNLAALFIFHYQIESVIFTENLPQFIGFFLLSQWLFIALQEVLFETTLGKTFFNLEFKRNHRSLLLRSMVFMMSTLCLGLGFYFRPQDQLGQITLKSKIES